MTALLVTGTGHGVGATVVTAALAALALSRGQRCTVVKPAQTGSGAGDLEEVSRLAGEQVQTVELARFRQSLSPAAAARASGLPPLDPARCADAVLQAERTADLVLVDGTGGLLTRYDEDGFTMAALARTLRLQVVVVASPGRDAANHAALTLEVLAHRGLDLVGIVVGAWAGTSDGSLLADLEMLAARPLLGALPAGLGSRDRADFLATARAGLAPALGGTFDPAAFRRMSTGEP